MDFAAARAEQAVARTEAWADRTEAAADQVTLDIWSRQYDKAPPPKRTRLDLSHRRALAADAEADAFEAMSEYELANRIIEDTPQSDDAVLDLWTAQHGR